MPRAFITGLTGQDGWYLASLLVERGYEVSGVARHAGEVPSGVTLHHGDMAVAGVLDGLLTSAAPDEVYHLAEDSSVADSWARPQEVPAGIVNGARRLLDACAAHCPAARVVVASSAEVFSGTPAPQREDTPLAPRSPYGRGKADALSLLRERRANTGAHLSAAILYNHESERRAPHFLSRKVSMGVAAIATGRSRELVLGNLDAARDWGYAPDYVEAMARMAQRPVGEDYVIGTGVLHTVRDLCAVAFGAAGLDPEPWVVSDPALFRPVDDGRLVADPGLAGAELGWRATTAFEVMITRMVEADLARLGAP